MGIQSWELKEVKELNCICSLFCSVQIISGFTSICNRIHKVLLMDSTYTYFTTKQTVYSIALVVSCTLVVFPITLLENQHYCKDGGEFC